MKLIVCVVPRNANFFPVEIGVTSSTEAIAYFNSRHFTIQLSEEIMSAEPESIAAVLMHEPTHAKQMIDGRLTGQQIDCYDGEVEAFEDAALFFDLRFSIAFRTR